MGGTIRLDPVPVLVHSQWLPADSVTGDTRFRTRGIEWWEIAEELEHGFSEDLVILKTKKYGDCTVVFAQKRSCK